MWVPVSGMKYRRSLASICACFLCKGCNLSPSYDVLDVILHKHGRLENTGQGQVAMKFV